MSSLICLCCALLPMVLAAMGAMLAVVWASLTISTHYTPEGEYEAWDDVMCDINWDETIVAEHAMLDTVEAHLSQCEADDVDASWLRTIAVAHSALDVLYCTMGANAVAPRLRYTRYVPTKGSICRALADGG